MVRNTAYSDKGVKFIIAFIVAAAIYICIAPTEASAVYMWSDGILMDWDTAVTNSENSPIDKTVVVTIDNTTAGGNVKVAPAGRVRVTGTDTVTGDFSMDIDGGTVTWEADLTKSGTSDNNFIEFGGGGSLTFTGANIEGAAKDSLIYIDSDISGVTITGGSFTNEINADGTFDYGKVIYSESTGTMSISDYTTISYTGSDDGDYALTHNGDLTLTNVTVSSTNAYGVLHPVSASTITITGGLIEAAGTALCTYAGGTITNTQIEKTGTLAGYALYATGNLEIDGTTSITAAGDTAVYYDGGTNTLDIFDGTFESEISAVYINSGNLNISDGRFTNTSSTNSASSNAVSFNGNLLEISGGAIIDGDKNTALLVNNSSAEVEISGGTISGRTGINVSNSSSVEVSGGTVTGTAASGNGIIFNSGDLILSGGTIQVTDTMSSAAVDFKSTGDLTISGATIEGSDTTYIPAVYMNNGDADLIITSGDISGGIAVEAYYAASVNISGGTFEGGRFGITSGYGYPLKISPATGETVTVLTGDSSYSAINDSMGTIDYTDVNYTLYSETVGDVPTDYILGAFTNNSAYKTLIFMSTAPEFSLTITGGTANGSSTPLPIAVGSTVDIAFNPALGTFTRWEAQGFTLADPTVPDFQMTMPQSAVTLTAIYETAALPGGRVSGSSSTMSYPAFDVLAGKPEAAKAERQWLERFAYKKIATYIWKDLSITTSTESGFIDDKTMIPAIKSAVRRARSLKVTEIELNIAEGTKLSDRILKEIARLHEAYGVEVIINYIENEE
jgi:hypothetical protein